jgi:thioredoxin-like negative regulator of GroEL
MKTKNAMITLSAAMAITLLAGCSKPADSNESSTGEQPAKETTTSVAEAITNAVKPIVDEATKAVESVKPAVSNAVQDVKEAAATATTDATAKANSLIDQAKKYINEAKYSDAANIINQLSTMKLTPEQEKLVADLKVQLQKAMSSLSGTNAAAAVGNLFKK